MTISTIPLYSTAIGKLILKFYDIDIEKICSINSSIVNKSVNSTFSCSFKQFIFQTAIDIYSVYIKNIIQLFFNLQHQTLRIEHKQQIVKSDSITVQISAKDDLLIDNLKIKHVYLENTKEIANDTFSCCFNLQCIFADESLEVIRNDAFQNCINLRTVYLPKTVKLICAGAFSNCINLEKVVFY